MASVRIDPSHATTTNTNASASPSTATSSRSTVVNPRFMLSIIVPAKNEAESLPRLTAEITAAFRPILGPRGDGRRIDGYELIVIDDGSTDHSVEVLRQLAAVYPEVQPIRFARNYGQSAAITAGFHAARGEWVAILDADLQNDPADLARLWDAMDGHEVGLGWRVKREDVWSKRIISRWANRVRNAVLGQSIRDTGCAVRIFPRAVALRLPMFHGVHRFFGPLLLREGCRVYQMPVNHRPRPHGKSHYNIWNRSLKVIVDLLGAAWLMRRSVYHETLPLNVAAIEAPAAGSTSRTTSTTTSAMRRTAVSPSSSSLAEE